MEKIRKLNPGCAWDYELLLDKINDLIDNQNEIIDKIQPVEPVMKIEYGYVKEKPKSKYFCKDCGCEINKGEFDIFGICDDCRDKFVKKNKNIPESEKQMMICENWKECKKNNGVINNTHCEPHEKNSFCNISCSSNHDYKCIPYTKQPDWQKGLDEAKNRLKSYLDTYETTPEEYNELCSIQQDYESVIEKMAKKKMI